MISRKIKFYEPIQTHRKDPQFTDRPPFIVHAHLWQLSGERAAVIMGIYTTQIWKCRFRDISKTRPEIKVGWKAEAENLKFTVQSVVIRPNGLYDITMENI